jgi:hypothetical protein
MRFGFGLWKRAVEKWGRSRVLLGDGMWESGLRRYLYKKEGGGWVNLSYLLGVEVG